MTAETIRTDATREMLAAVDEFLLANEAVQTDFELKNVVVRIRRARREFDATLFFVVVCGPLKAGKSTLVNAFAREYVSPTAFGKEATRRPSIVIQHAQTGIDQYYPKNSAVDEKQAFDKVIDFLRGMIDERELNETIFRESFPLNELNIEEKLSASLNREPLITVIRVPGGNLISRGIGLLDMPGLDGDKSHWEKDLVHEWVLRRSDFIIFIQSSMAALNGDTIKFLQDVVRESHQPPIWLVQNFIDSKHWREIKERDEEKIRQQENAVAQIRTILGLKTELFKTAINLGEASDGIFRGHQELLETSKFVPFEQNLKKVLDFERIGIQEQNSVNRLEITFGEALRILDDKKIALENEIKNYQNALEKLDEVAAFVNFIDYSRGSQDLLSKVSDSVAKQKNNWRTAVEAKKLLFAAKYDKRIAGATLNDALKDFSVESAKLAGAKFFDNNGAFGAEIKEWSLKELVSNETPTLEKVNPILQTIGLSKIPAAQNWTTAKMPKISDAEFDADRVASVNWYLTQKFYDGQEVKTYLNLAETSIKSDIETRAEDYLNYFETNYRNDFCEERRANLRQFLTNERQTFERNKKNELEKINSALGSIAEMRREINELKSLTAQAEQSLTAKSKTKTSISHEDRAVKNN